MNIESVAGERSWRRSLKRITTIILALAFILVSVTGVQMKFPQSGGGGGKPPVIQGGADGNSAVHAARVAPAGRPFYPKEAHEWAGYLFIVAGCVHLALNFKSMRSYLRLRGQ